MRLEAGSFTLLLLYSVILYCPIRTINIFSIVDRGFKQKSNYF
uniref:Uncharacterized protein n=1 Tax=Siphoviridae sp. ct73V17 TaxID=2826302 RepID=A0A8S5M6J9_9CAUD|nr:MAG TPA: hypothetical protein [Siphoviridae sp. ct73V17]DAN66974.1 MAG TPA: hypothetical protein [Caudoviricetes sp.]